MTEENLAKPHSSWYLLASIVDQPGAALAEIVVRPRWRWVLPVTLALLVTVASVVATAPYLAAQAKQELAGVLNALPADQLAQVQNQMGFIQSPLFIGATAAVTGILGLLVGWLVQGALLYFGALIAGGEVEFRRFFAAMPWLGLPLVLGTVVRTVYALIKHQLVVNDGLSYLVSSGKPMTDARNPAYVTLSSVTLFWLWHLLLVYVLLRVAPKLGRGTAFFLTVLYAALTVGVRVGLAALSGAMSPAL
jgi:hypothetical protein